MQDAETEFVKQVGGFQRALHPLRLEVVFLEQVEDESGFLIGIGAGAAFVLRQKEWRHSQGGAPFRAGRAATGKVVYLYDFREEAIQLNHNQRQGGVLGISGHIEADSLGLHGIAGTQGLLEGEYVVFLVDADMVVDMVFVDFASLRQHGIGK